MDATAVPRHDVGDHDGVAPRAPGSRGVLGVLPSLLVTLIALVQLGLYLATFTAMTAQEVRSRDFSASYVGALLLGEGQGGHLYDLAAQMPVLRQVEGNAAAQPLPFVYPPTTALAFLPLTALPVSLAERVWSLLQLGFVVAAAVVVARSAPWPGAPRSQRSAGGGRSARGVSSGVVAASVLAAAAGTGTAIMLLQGQFTGILTFGLAMAYAAWTRGHGGRAALVITVAFLAFKPHLAIGLAVYILALRDRRALLGLGAGSLAVIGLSLAAVGGSGLVGFLNAPSLSGQISPVQTMLGFMGMAGSQFGPGWVTNILTGVFSLAALAGCWLAGTWARGRRLGLEIPLAAAVILSLLLAPHLLVHDLVLLTPVVVWCLAAAAQRDSRAAGRWPGRAGIGVLSLWFVLGWAARGTHPDALPRRLVPYLLITAALALAAAAFQSRPASGEQVGKLATG